MEPVDSTSAFHMAKNPMACGSVPVASLMKRLHSLQRWVTRNHRGWGPCTWGHRPREVHRPEGHGEGPGGLLCPGGTWGPGMWAAAQQQGLTWKGAKARNKTG